MAETGFLSIQELLRVINECSYVDENGNRYLSVLGKDDEPNAQSNATQPNVADTKSENNVTK